MLLLAVVRPDLPQFEGKAMAGRAIGYPIAVLVVPVVWWLLRRRRPVAYPYDVDILFTLPFLIDVAGNALDLYDTVDWWDDANHFVNWAILSLGFSRVLVRLPLGRWVVAGLTVGFGAVTAILWEYAEYVTFIRNSPELDRLHGHAARPRARPRRLGAGRCARHDRAVAQSARKLA
ncbi:MAG TPA: hypothetical protein VFR32_09115 [Gaiellaceae bacterium]|nr:hypothetical protein [Gaiellaceae bacterium]